MEVQEEAGRRSAATGSVSTCAAQTFTTLEQAEAALTAAIAAADLAHGDHVTAEGTKWPETWDDGSNFNYGDPADGMTPGSAQHQAETDLFHIVQEVDRLQATSKEELCAQQLHRAVPVSWLKTFALDLDLTWTTRDVVMRKIKPMTRARRCRFTELDGMVANTGAADVFVSHTWGAPFRELCAALSYALPPETRVWLDVFAVRQWPGNRADLEFEPVVRSARALVLVASHLEQVAAHTPETIMGANVRLQLTGEEGQQKGLQLLGRNGRAYDSDQLPDCAFFRIWCVVELWAALRHRKPVVMLVGGVEQTPAAPFVPNASMLDTMVELINVDCAIATKENDRVECLEKIRKTDGTVKVNCKARAACIAAKHCMGMLPVVHAAVTGDDASLQPSVLAAAERGRALLAAAAVGLTSGVQVLLNGADSTPSDRRLALHLAAGGGHLPVVRLLLEHGPAVEQDVLEEAFLQSCRRGQAEVAEELLRRNVQIDG